MLRSVLVLLVFGLLILSLQAYGQTIELSSAQMEEAKGGCWAMCDKEKHCCDHIGCYYPGYPAPYSYLYQPYLHYVCSFSIYPASCSNLNPAMKCCTILIYELPGCNGEYWIGTQVLTEPGCGYYP
ncbi:MAG: hypothetical protein ACPL7E_07040 [bacterium]